MAALECRHRRGETRWLAGLVLAGSGCRRRRDRGGSPGGLTASGDPAPEAGIASS